MNLLQELLTQVQAINLQEVQWPQDKIEEGQTVVGLASEDARRLWGFLEELNEQLKALQQEHSEICDGDCDELESQEREQHDQIIKQFHELAVRHGVVKKIFWNTLRLEYLELLVKDCVIGIGIDHQVYWEKPRKRPFAMIETVAFGGGPLPTDLAQLFAND